LRDLARLGRIANDGQGKAEDARFMLAHESLDRGLIPGQAL
jgi:hypothetical protein